MNQSIKFKKEAKMNDINPGCSADYNKQCIERLLAGLDLRRVPIKGRVKAIAEKTGYSPGMVSKVLAGKVTSIERFVKVACSEYDIDERYVYGDDFRPLIDTCKDDELNLADKTKMFFPVELMELFQVGKGAVAIEALSELKKMSEPMRWSAVAWMKQINAATVPEGGARYDFFDPFKEK